MWLTPVLAQAPGWVLYTHPDKLMSVRFPGKPKEIEKDAPSSVGDLHFKGALFEDAERGYFATAVVYAVEGKFDIQKALDGGRDQALANVHGKAISEKPLRLDGFQGREMQFEGTIANDRRIRGVARFFVSASPPSSFIVIALRYPGKPDPDSQRFLDSLHLGKKVERRP